MFIDMVVLALLITLAAVIAVGLALEVVGGYRAARAARAVAADARRIRRPVRLILRDGAVVAQVGVNLAWVDAPLSHPDVLDHINGLLAAGHGATLPVTR